MMTQLKQLIQQQWLFFSLYFLVFGVGLYFTLSEDKLTGHVILNQYNAPFFDTFFYYITYLGDGVISVIILAIVAIYNYRYALVGAISFGVSALITQVLKITVYDHVERPYIALWNYFHYDPNSHLVRVDEYIKLNNSFPSGHTTGAFAIFLFLALYSKNKWLGLVCIVMAILTSFSRVYLSQHFIEDTLAGSLIGIGISLVAFAIYEKSRSKKLRMPTEPLDSEI
jgi:membrane-associated phospholipid phosphatase